MKKLTLGEIAKMVGGSLIGDSELCVFDVKKDSREVSKGDLFIALSGERFDAHDFVQKAYELGAVGAIVSHKVPCEISQIIVEEPCVALGDLARKYIAQLDVSVVGVTGSVGKTTTKEMTAAVLAKKAKTLKTEVNLNNHIGMPMMVMRLDSSYSYAVLEMGMNHFGEISYLTNIARPALAVITNIGKSHIEHLGSMEGILKAKLEILEGLDPNGTIILNGDSELLWEIRGSLKHKVVYYGVFNPEVDIFGQILEKDTDSISFKTNLYSDMTFTINVGGTHNVQNALAAIAVGREYGIEGEKIRDALFEFCPLDKRQQTVKLNGLTVINDCYNAGPDSMTAALHLLGEDGTKGRKIAVLGDMLELGEYSDTAHLDIGVLAASKADALFCFGPKAQLYYSGAKGKNPDFSAFKFENKAELIRQLKLYIRPDDIVLVKGSRGMKMEEIVEELKNG